MVACRLCGDRRYMTIIHDYRCELGKAYSLRQCQRCSFVSIDPLPTEEDLGKYYHKNYWQKEEGFQVFRGAGETRSC